MPGLGSRIVAVSGRFGIGGFRMGSGFADFGVQGFTARIWGLGPGVQGLGLRV